MTANQILDYALQNGASDVILIEGALPCVRLGRKVGQIPETSPIPSGFLDEFLGVLPESAGVRLVGPFLDTMWRVRYSRGAMGKTAILRPLLSSCPDFYSLGIPDSLQNLLSATSGVIVVMEFYGNLVKTNCFEKRRINIYLALEDVWQRKDL